MSLVITGVAASPGIAFGTAFRYEPVDVSFDSREITDAGTEVTRLHAAFDSAISEIRLLKDRVHGELGEEFAHIFRAQQTVLEDESIRSEIEEEITAHLRCAEQAASKVYQQYADLFEELGEDDYNRSRVADLNDVSRRVIRNLLGKAEADLAAIPGQCVVVAHDLTPSDTTMMDKDRVVGIVTEKGGVTSHVAILAKTLGIPAAVSVSGIMESVTDGQHIALDARDAEAATVTVEPSSAERQELETAVQSYRAYLQELSTLKDLPPVTTDGRTVILSANIGAPSDLDSALENGARSVGLYRTEFLFLQSSKLPDEEKQYQAYRTVAERLDAGMTVIRTLDIGGDKKIPSFSIPPEENPFLGYRAVRISLANVDMFKAQLRAIYRASAHGNVKMMFPMISCVSEVRQIKGILDEVRSELKAGNVPHNPDAEVGIMLEIPSAAIMARELLREVDFVSFGTNDLTQYLLAADRMNENVRTYYRTFHPAVFRMIKTVTDEAHAQGKWVGVCGELAGITDAIPVLLGLGVDELSMTAQLLPRAIGVIRSTSWEQCRSIASEVLSLDTDDAIKSYLTSVLR